MRPNLDDHVDATFVTIGGPAHTCTSFGESYWLGKILDPVIRPELEAIDNVSQQRGMKRYLGRCGMVK